MPPDHWLTVAGVAAAWTAALGGLVYYLDAKRSQRWGAIQAKIDSSAARATEEHRQLRAQMDAEHTMMQASMKDMERTIKDEFVHRREFDVSMRNLESGLTEARKEIGAVSVRIDRLIERS